MGVWNGIYRFMEDQQQARHERNMAALRVLGSQTGMLILCIVFTLICAGLLWSALPINNRPTGEWSVVDEKGRIVDVQKELPYMGVWSDEQLVQIYGDFYGWHLEPARAPRLTEHENFTRAILFAVFAFVSGIRAFQLRREEKPERSVPERAIVSSSPSDGTDSGKERLDNLRRLYDAGVLSREEYNERKKKLT